MLHRSHCVAGVFCAGMAAMAPRRPSARCWLPEARRANNQMIAASRRDAQWTLQVRRALVDDSPVRAIQMQVEPARAGRVGVLLAIMGGSDLALGTQISGKPPLLAALTRARVRWRPALWTILLATPGLLWHFFTKVSRFRRMPSANILV